MPHVTTDPEVLFFFIYLFEYYVNSNFLNYYSYYYRSKIVFYGCMYNCSPMMDQCISRQCDLLSPVHLVAYRPVPAKDDLVMVHGRLPGKMSRRTLEFHIISRSA